MPDSPDRVIHIYFMYIKFQNIAVEIVLYQCLIYFQII